LVFWVNLTPFSLASQNIVDRSYRRYNLAAELPAVTEAWSLLVNILVLCVPFLPPATQRRPSSIALPTQPSNDSHWPWESCG
jgi:hypothetical protein